MAQARRILVVEDDASTRRLVRLTLEYEGYEVSEAFDGGQAMDMVRTQEPDLILLDIGLPNINGWEVLSRLKGDVTTCRTPVVMLTGEAAETSEQRARDLGAVTYVAKPVGMDDLVHVLDRVLRSALERRIADQGL